MNMDHEIISKAGEIINAKTGFIGEYATLALIDENAYPTASTFTIIKADGIKWITFHTYTDRDSVKRITKCNRASVCVNSSEYNITLVGTIEIITDLDVKKDMWFPGMKYHWSGFDDPNYCVLRFNTERYSLYVDNKRLKGNI